MRKHILFWLSSLISLFSFAQIPTNGGPDAYGYSFKTNAHATGPTYSWIDITSVGTPISGLGDDNVVGPFNVGFNFPFYWTEVSSFYVGSNGYVMFENGTTISSGGDPAFPIPPTTGDIHENFVAPLLSDLNFTQDAGGANNPATAYYYSNGVDTCIISFLDVPFWTSTNANGWIGNNTFQVILCGSDSSVTYQYQTQAGSWNPGYDGNSAASIIGMESIGALSGINAAASILPTSGLAIRFDLSVSPSFNVTDLSAEWNGNSGNGGIFVSQQYPVGISTNIGNVGTEDVTTSFNVNTTITEVTGGNFVTSFNQSVSSLLSGQSTTINYTPALDMQNFSCGGACDAGSYTVVTDIAFTDNNPLNDAVTTEMVLLDESTPTSVSMSFADNESEAIYGFEGGAVYIKPPHYPVDLHTLMYQLISNTGSAPVDGFEAKVYDDNGPGGTAGTTLFSQTVPAGSITYQTGPAIGGFHSVNLSTPVTITSGGVYIAIEFINYTGDLGLAVDQTAPFSNQNYEILSGSFGDYRSNSSEDLMIKGVFEVDTVCVQNYTSSASLCTGSSLTFGSQTITSAGTYYESFSGATCDSLVALTVTMLPALTGSINAAICPGASYNFGGTLLFSAGTYYDTIPQAGTCDSIITLNLSVASLIKDTINATICSGTSYSIGSSTYSAAGTYVDTITSGGCDSIITLFLSVIPVNTSVTVVGGSIVAQFTDATFQWVDCNTNLDIPGETGSIFTPTSNGSYAVRVTQNGCSKTTGCFDIIVGSVGALNIQEHLSLYPNPAKNTVTLQSSDQLRGMEYVIINTLGTVMHKGVMLSEKEQVSLENVESGYYLVGIENSFVPLIVR